MQSLSGRCPESHPFAYNEGYHCCQTGKEKYYSPQGKKCDGGEIHWDSKCCENDKAIECPSGRCGNYNLGKSLRIVFAEIFKFGENKEILALGAKSLLYRL